MSAILAAIGSLATICGAFYGIFKWLAWKAQVTPEQKKETIDQKEREDEIKEQQTGRPPA